MKSEIKPAMAAVVILVIVVIVGFFIYRGANAGPGAKSPGQVGNTGPFSPGGAANAGQAAKPKLDGPPMQR